MKKLYIKPDAQYVSLIAEEAITSDETNDDMVDGDFGIESSIFPF